MAAQKPIFCLICDRATGYFQMTVQAIKCLRKHTKTVAIGVVFVHGLGDLTESGNMVLEALKKLDPKIDRSNIFFKEGTNRFENWNPTQHKLDIQLFATEYDPVVWLDSDTVVLKDLVPFIKSFVSTNKKIALLSDHVNNDENFRKNWEGPVFIPQACYMMFRSAYISAFFKIWEDIWREWITPYPFAVHKDPAPHFNNSFFCIEQYALGQSLFKFTQNFEKDIEIIDRSQLFIGRNVAVETQKIKQQFQQKSASRPSAVAYITQSPLIEKSLNPPPRSPQSVPLETGSTSASSIAWGGVTPVSTAYAAEIIGAEGGFLVTATYTATPGIFQENIEPTTSSTSFSAAESDLSVVTDTLNAMNIKPVSIQPSSYVTSYGMYPSSYASSYGAVSVSSYGAAAGAGGVTSYGAAVGGVTSYGAAVGGVTSYGAAVGGVTSYGAAVGGVTSYGAATGGVTSYGAAVGGVTSYGAAVGGVTSYGAAVGGVTSYGAAVGGVTSYGAAVGGVTSYGAAAGGVTSYGAAVGGVTSYGAGGGGVGITSYGAVTSYGGTSSYPSSYASSSGLSSPGVSSFHPDGGIPLTNYGNLTFQFSLPPTPDSPTEDSETTKASVFVYGSADANVYFLSTNATLTSSAPAQNNLSNSNNEYYMVDLIQDNSIAHYYNANQGTNSDFVVNHGSAVADTITQIKTQTSSKGKKGTKGGK